MNNPVYILNLGAGVQSSTLALMCTRGEVTPKPDAAIFADTQAEPKSVYRWLDWLEKQLSFPLYRVTKGSLEADTLRVRQRKDGLGMWNPSGVPHYSINADGSKGHGPRQCTHDFKIIPIMRQVRVLMKQMGVKKAVQYIGISADEAHRMKPSRVRYSAHRWPLVDLGMTRAACLLWMTTNSYPTPPRSACVFCPYHSDVEWRRLKNEEPEEFERAARFEELYQATKAQTLRSKNFVPYLHADRVPLRQVDLSIAKERGQGELFGNECEGLCGV